MAYTVTAVIAVYNGAADIRRAIDSVLAQSRPVDEVIVVDDGSTDTTGEIVRGYGDRIRLLRQQNSGVAAARNHGIREARSEWIALLDHDDEWLPQKIEMQLAALEKQPAARLCYTAYWSHMIGVGARRHHLATSELWPYAGLRNPFPPSTVIFRKAELLKLGGFDERLKGASCEDWELFVRYLSAYPSIDVPEPLLRYYETPASNSRKYQQMLRNSLFIVESLLSGLSGYQRFAWRRRIQSGMYFRAALSATENGDASWGYLFRSLWHWPFLWPGYPRVKRLAVLALDALRPRPAIKKCPPACD